MLMLKKTSSILRIASINLTLVLVLFVLFIYWLNSESDDEQLIKIVNQYKQLTIQNNQREADQLLEFHFSDDADKPLNPIWIQLVEKTDGFIRLGLYERLIRFDVDHEDYYSSAAKLLKLMPIEYQAEIKKAFVSNLKDIPNIRQEYLLKYEL